MKKSVKALLTVLCVIVLVVATVLGTLAYMTDRSTVTNTFTVGNVNITVDEAKVNEYGEPTKDGQVVGSVDDADRTQETDTNPGNNYKLIPGMTYVKDPTMTIVDESEPSYVRMMVTINNISVLKEAVNGEFYPHNHISGWKNETWQYTSVIEDGDSRTYEFRYVGSHADNGIVSTVGADKDLVLEPLFTNFTAPAGLTSELLNSMQDFKIEVVGHAIQAETFNDADEAWAAFTTQNG